MSTTPWRDPDFIEENPINLPEESAKQIIPELDAHLASFFVLFHQYQKHHWLVEGPQFRDIHHFLEENYNEVHKQLDAIAERVTAIGGVPTSSPTSQSKLAYIEHEPEGVFRIRDMLERDRSAEGHIAAKLRSTIRLCTEHGDFGSETLLKKILLKVEDRAHHLDHFLGEDSLGMALDGSAQEA
ncbi:MAG: DNA starvation/stationary phase protection protein DpsA [Phycisphaerales bacterium]|jgi:starvation-inducible DNA-binding protein